MKLSKRRSLPTFWTDFPSLLSDWNGWADDFINISPNAVLNRVGITTPAINVKETEQEYNIEVAAPGMEKKDFNVSVDAGILTISSVQEKKSEKKEDSYTRKEFSYSSFHRSFTLPENVNADAIIAKYEKGVLNITLPKVKLEKPKAKAKTIAIA